MSAWLASIRSGHGHWPLLGAIAVLGFVMIGTCAISVGLLMDPLRREFGWSNGAASVLATIYSLSCMLGSPLIGLIVDKFGAKPVMAAGIVITAAGFLLVAFSSTLPAFYAAFLLIGVGYGGAFYLAIWKIVPERLGDQKNLGMGVFAGVGSIGAAIFSVTAGVVIAELGWRIAAIAAAGIVLAMTPVVIKFIPAPLKVNANEAVSAPAFTGGAEPGRMMLSPYFSLAVFVSALAAFGMSSVFFHIVPILTKTGLTEQQASQVFGATWLVSGIGSLCIGAVAHRIGASTALAGAMFLGAAGTVFLLLIGTGPLSALAIGLFILLWGATANAVNQFMPILFAERFGAAHLGLLLGVQSALMGIVGSIAPVATGMLYDRYEGYTIPVLTSIGVTFTAFIFALGLSRGLRRRVSEART